MPEVSVVIVGRNAGQTIRAALGSVFAQTFQDFEVIVVDLASTDDTGACVSAWPHPIRLVPCAGSRIEGFQEGIAAATGRLIAFLNAADVWVPRKLERQLAYFSRFADTGLVHAQVLWSKHPAATPFDGAQPAHENLEDPGAAPRAIAGLMAHTSTIVARRDALSDICRAPVPPTAEQDLWSEVAARRPVGFIPLPLAVRRAWHQRPDDAAARPGNLVHDTMYRRARRSVVAAVHRVDQAIDRMSRADVRILFEAASPMSVAVFRPVLDRLLRDPRLEFWFTGCDSSWDPHAIFAGAGITERVRPARDVRWRKFDAYVNTDFWNMTWLPRRTRRIHFFHGVAGKYGLDAPAGFAPAIATFDRVMFPNRDRLRRYADAGLVDPHSSQAALIGYPKVDSLVDGSLNRSAIQRSLQLRADALTVLYAPTWSPHSSLHTVGLQVLDALSRLDLNVIVKLHDRSYDAAARASAGVDWRRQIERLCRERGIHLATDPDASPYMYVADALVTDHSSVGFEFMLLDRPVVILDCPELIDRAGINPEKVAMLRSAADVIPRTADVASAVLGALAEPARHAIRRRFVANELFYCPGSATHRAVQTIYDLLTLPLPAPADLLQPVRIRSGLTFEARTT